MAFTLLYWHWLIFGMLLTMLEILLPSFTALWFGIGALLVGLLLLVFPEMSVGWQIFIWAVASAAATWGWFRFLKPRSGDRTKAGLSREAIVGESGQVISVPFEKKRGVLRFTMPILGADEWPFICDEPVSIGDRLIVNDVAGNTLLVRKRK
mgnify:CR=1 FL=1